MRALWNPPWPRPGLPGLNDRRPDMVQQYKQVQAQRVSDQGGPQNIEVKNIVLFLKKLLLFEIPYSTCPQCLWVDWC